MTTQFVTKLILLTFKRLTFPPWEGLGYKASGEKHAKIN